MKYDVVGISNILIDMLVQVDDGQLEKTGLQKGQSHLLDDEAVHSILNQHEEHHTVPAGATTNTLMGIAALGGKCILVGRIGPGIYGDMFEEVITREGIKARLIRAKKSKTGKTVTMITPDAERTFAVSLGACLKLTKEAILDKDIENSEYLYFTGYEFESVNSVIEHAMKTAKKYGVKIAMDLADPGLVNRNKDKLCEAAKDVNILFMNETEAEAMTGLQAEAAAIEMAKIVKTVVVKIGSEGSIVVADGRLYRIEAVEAKAVDTTGAGDLYAAGYLYGITHGKSPEQAGKLGSLMGAKIVEQVGAMLEEQAKQDIRRLQDL